MLDIDRSVWTISVAIFSPRFGRMGTASFRSIEEAQTPIAEWESDGFTVEVTDHSAS